MREADLEIEACVVDVTPFGVFLTVRDSTDSLRRVTMPRALGKELAREIARRLAAVPGARIPPRRHRLD
jgi:hypothetical protein